MANLNTTFPGDYRTSHTKDYRFYLVGNIFDAKKLNMDGAIYAQLEEVSLELGRFSALIDKIPNPTGYIHAFNFKEANESSRIEGTQTDIEDVFKDEEIVLPEKRDDYKEVMCYIKALNFAIEELKTLPLCNRLIKSTHKILLSHSRGEDKLPGEFRKSQNWIGGSRPDNARFVPPAAEYVDEAMGNLENFIHDEKLKIPHLIKAALIHYQFETIHPFLDGNGRIGRMLIPLFLLQQEVLRHPILYISNFFENRRNDYYDLLDGAREGQDGVVKWVSFFLDAVHRTASHGIDSSEKILSLKEKIVTQKIPGLGKMVNNAMRLLDLLFEKPVISSSQIIEKLQVSPQTAQGLINKFVLVRIVSEITGYKRNRIFVFGEYFQLLR